MARATLLRCSGATPKRWRPRSRFPAKRSRSQQASATLVSSFRSGAPAAAMPASAIAASSGASSKRCQAGTLQWTQRLSQTAMSPARTRTTRGCRLVSPVRSGLFRGRMKKSLWGCSGQRLKSSSCFRCEPGSTERPPVLSSPSSRLTKPCAQAKLLPVVFPLWSTWYQHPFVRHAESMCGGRKALHPSKLITSSCGSSRPQMSANACSTAGLVLTYHMKGDWPMPAISKSPFSSLPGHFSPPQVSGSLRKTLPRVACSTNSQNSPVAVATSSALKTSAKTA
mmetsp:Transcript_102386/g.330238  ORF Transcript_102386/g.330238 Transcript_102386/m.330238 type:complete len:282 (-) Transcript_102386:534-1379(-)